MVLPLNLAGIAWRDSWRLSSITGQRAGAPFATRLYSRCSQIRLFIWEIIAVLHRGALWLNRGVSKALRTILSLPRTSSDGSIPTWHPFQWSQHLIRGESTERQQGR